MQLSEAFLALGEEPFAHLVRQISMGKLRTYQLYEGLKTRAHLPKINTEHLRKAAPRLWARLNAGEEELAKELGQAVLVSHLDMVQAVLDLLGIPNQNGFFEKNLDASPYLTEGWQQRVWEKLHGQHPEPALRFYINHLSWELAKPAELFTPAA
jgi:inorganic triphosphatase YgiF